MVGNQSGIKLSRFNGRGVEFSEVRAYQPGDDVRSIDWRVTARKNKPHTKIFHEEREHPTIIAIDQTQSMFFGSQTRLKSVAAAELAARIAWQTLYLGDKVGGLVKTNESYSLHKPRRSNKSVSQLLNTISKSNQALSRTTRLSDTGFLDHLAHLNRLSKNRYRIYLLTDFTGDMEKWNDVIAKLSRSHHLVCLHITDPLEETLPPSGYYTVTDGNRRVQFFSGNNRAKKNYENEFQAKCKNIKDTCARHAVRYIRLKTNEENIDRIRIY